MIQTRESRRVTNTDFTTGQAAKICRVSQQTIIRCVDNGTLKGYKVPGGSRFRRITRVSLEQFMREHNIPMDLLQSKIMYVGNDVAEVNTLRGLFDREKVFYLDGSGSPFLHGMNVEQSKPHLVIVDLSLPPSVTREFGRLRYITGFQETGMIGLLPENSDEHVGCPV